jgi:NAD(P)-dependent dehydrogenase (short-subunit alcohol dehydrogenase family)
MPNPEMVVVTGAAAGVGRAVAHRFAREGAHVGLIARDGEALAAVKCEVEERGGVGLVLPADVADPAAVFEAARQAEHAWGHIDVWVNDAMATVFSPIEEITPEEFRRVTEVTYLGCVHGTMAALKAMRRRGRGAIVQVGSALAYRGIPLQTAYCGAKHAIRGFTNGVRAELMHERAKISLSIVELPAMNTPQFDWARTHMPRQPRPMGRVYEPEAAAGAVWRAAHAGGREYWLGRTTLLTIVGNMVAPGLMDRYLARTAVKGQATRKPVSPQRRDNLFAPVHALHRTRGSFDGEAHDRALLVPGQAARIGAVAAGAAVFLGAGLLAGHAMRGRG